MEKLVLALKMEICGEELKIISARECWNDTVVHVEVREYTLVGDWGVGLTRIAQVVIEMQMQGEEISHSAPFLRVEAGDEGISL